MTTDPTTTNPDFYKIVFENDRVRVLEYLDHPGDHTTLHAHPDSVMITLSDFERRLSIGDQQRDVSLTAGLATWLPAQSHAGENVGSTDTHTIFVELKEAAVAGHRGEADLGPQL